MFVGQVLELGRSSARAGVRLVLVSNFQQVPPMTPRGRFREGMLLDLACPGAELVLDQVGVYVYLPSSWCFNVL